MFCRRGLRSLLGVRSEMLNSYMSLEAIMDVAVSVNYV